MFRLIYFFTFILISNKYCPPIHLEKSNYLHLKIVTKAIFHVHILEYIIYHKKIPSARFVMSNVMSNVNLQNLYKKHINNFTEMQSLTYM